MVGYPVAAKSPYLRRGLIPSWAKPTLVVRDERILTPDEAAPVREGDYLYLLAPPEKAQALDRFFVDMPPPAAPDPRLLGDFFVSGDVTLGALAEIYGLSVAADARGNHAGGSFRRASSSARRGRATSCRSGRSRCSPTRSPTAASPPSACGSPRTDEAPAGTLGRPRDDSSRGACWRGCG